MAILNEIVYWLTIKPLLLVLQSCLPEAKISPTGSRFICNPPTLYTDIDFVVYSKSNLDSELIKIGFKKQPHSMSYGEPTFASWRNRKVNIIITDSLEFYERFVVATHLCRQVNVYLKVDRISVFKAIRTLSEEDLNAAIYYTSLYKKRNKLVDTLNKFRKPHGKAMVKIYMAKYGLS